jgi:hypothetical protein
MAPVLAFKAYTLWSPEPTYTTPFATAGEDLSPEPVVKLHSICNPGTLETLRVFS